MGRGSKTRESPTNSPGRGRGNIVGRPPKQTNKRIRIGISEGSIMNDRND